MRTQLIALLFIPLIAGCSASAGTPQPQNSVNLLRYEITREHFPEGTWEIWRESNKWPDPLRIDVPAGSQIIDREATDYDSGCSVWSPQTKVEDAAKIDHCENQLVVLPDEFMYTTYDALRIIIAY